MAYHRHLERVRGSFAGGNEGSFYFDALARIERHHIDWLDIGIGHDGTSIRPFVDFLRSRGRTASVIGVDPDATGTPPDISGVGWTLCAQPFEAWDSESDFDIINADQTLYYLSDLPAELMRIARFLRPSGTFLATSWLHDDSLHLLRQRLFPDAVNDLTGEKLLGLIDASGAFEIMKTTVFEHGLDIGMWRGSDEMLASAVRVIARSSIVVDLAESANRLATLLDAMPASASRHNLAILAQRR